MINYFFRDSITPPRVVAFMQGDVSGDGISDNIYLTGVKLPDSPFTQKITLVIQNGANGGYTRIPLSDNAGYNPRLFLGNFTGDSTLDILISIDSGGSGGIMYHYVYSFLNDKPNLLFDSNSYNEEYLYEVAYMDNYKVEVFSNKNNRKYIIDISGRGEEYLNEIYEENGKLKNPISGFVNPLSGLYPIDFNSDNVYDLQAYQKIAGRYNADALGYFLNTLKWENNLFILDNQFVAIS